MTHSIQDIVRLLVEAHDHLYTTSIESMNPVITGAK
jgi:hypothetical protein